MDDQVRNNWPSVLLPLRMGIKMIKARFQPSQFLPLLPQPYHYSPALPRISKLESRRPFKRASGLLFIQSIGIALRKPSRTSVRHACTVTTRSLKLGLSAPIAAKQPRKVFMTNPSVRNDNQIDDVCSSAICQEIADRLLRAAFAVKSDRLPQRIKMPVEPLAGIDFSTPTVRGHSMS